MNRTVSHSPLLCTLGTLWLLLPTALGQGSAQGYGQGGSMGGMGGGMGGGMMGGGGGMADRISDGDNDSQAKRKVDVSDRNLWQEKSAILTPGDRVEFKFRLEPGQTLLCGVETDSFDAALSLVDEKGTEIGKNDDRAEGEQSPFLIFHSKKGETLTLKVLSFRSAAGGRFTLRSRLATTINLATMSGTAELVPNPNQPMLVRLEAKKGRYYDFSKLEGMRADLNPRERYLLQPTRVIGPSGLDGEDGQIVAQNLGGRTIISEVDGPIYVEITNPFSTKVEWSVHEVETKTVTKEGDLTLPMPDDRIHVLEFPVVAREFVRTKFSGNPGFNVQWDYPFKGRTAYADEGISAVRGATIFMPSLGNNRDVIQLFHGEGTVKLFLRSYIRAPMEMKISNTQKLPVWEEGKEFKADLAIGESKFFLVKSTKSELMRIALQAKGFAPQLDIFSLTGDRLNSMNNRTNLRVADDLYYPAADTFLVRINCLGFGGSGSYTLERSTLTGAEYKLGGVAEAVINEKRFGLFEVELESQKWYEFRHDTSGKAGVQVDLLDGEGNFLRSIDIQLDKMNRRFFRTNVAGKHRLWIRGPFGSYPFKIVPYVGPSLTDK